MAQTGFTPILIYSSSTASQAPSAGNLTNSTLGSELAINITDGKLFYKDNANAVQVIGWKTVPTSAGGTGLTSYTAGDLVYYASGTAFNKLAIGASGNYLSSSGSAPQWSAPAALTKTDDTNVTLTLGGSASTALLNTASLTLGWTGTLAVSRGGTGTGTAGITAFNNITGYTASGATGTTSTNLVFSTSPTLTTPKATTTIGVGNATPSASGSGITFPATASDSSDVNTLDDYEEGTWTPTYVPTTGTFTSITYDSQTSGRYIKIGNTVFIQGAVRTDAITFGTASGIVKVGGLPFTVVNASPFAAISVGFVAAFAGDMPTEGYFNLNATTIQLLYRTTSNGASIDLDVTDLGTGANANYVIFEGFYSVT